jgi:hypothetical protein
MGKIEMPTKFWLENLKGRNQSKYISLGADGRMQMDLISSSGTLLSETCFDTVYI